MANYTVDLALKSPAGVVRYQKSLDTGADGCAHREVTVNNGDTDKEVVLRGNLDSVKGFILESDQNVLVQANSGGSPTWSTTLVAGVPQVFMDVFGGEGFSGLTYFDTGTEDFVNLFITNASGATATVKIFWLRDV